MFQNLTESGLDLKRRDRPEMTSSFDSSALLLYKWSVDMFHLSLSVQKLFNILVLASKRPLGKILGDLGDSRSLNATAHQRFP
jgi:hypothetical protein